MKKYSREEMIAHCQAYEDQKMKISQNAFLAANIPDVNVHEFNDWRDELSAEIRRKELFPVDYLKELAIAGSEFLGLWLERVGAPPAAKELANTPSFLLWSLLKERPDDFSLDEDMSILDNVSTILQSIDALNGRLDMTEGIDFKMIDGVEQAPLKLEPFSMPGKSEA